ncbi:uncharacterized protein LOC134226968 [Armigeres subalbatus]|uniref:uncharacterized protein LOC134226968 n=1 Tax=Armigeres subalbatus TaxID=124917 RepID=UPI002ED5C371
MEEYEDDIPIDPNVALSMEVIEEQEEIEYTTEPIEANDPGMPKFTNEFVINKLLYRHQQSEAALEFSVIHSNSLEEFIDEVYQLIQPFIKREIEFHENNQPCWAEREFPAKEDLHRYVAFKDRVRKKTYRIDSITESMLGRWHKRDIILIVYLHSNNLDTRASWDIAREALLGDANAEGTRKVVKVLTDDEKLQLTIKKLQRIHQCKLTPTTKDSYTLWARMIMQQSSKKQRDRYFMKPPRQILANFEVIGKQAERKKRTIVSGPAQRGHSRDGYGFEDEVSALRQTVIQIKDLVEMLDRRVELLEEKCQGFKQTPEGVPFKRGRYDGESENDDHEADEETTIDAAQLVQVDCEQGNTVGNPDPLFEMQFIKDEIVDCDTDD